MLEGHYLRHSIKTLYIKANGPLEALDALNHVGGFKHNARFPDIISIGEPEMIATLKQIASSVGSHSTRRNGYCVLFDDEPRDYTSNN